MNTPFCDNTAASSPVLPAWLAAAAVDLRDLHHHWLAVRADRQMPDLADFDLAELVISYPGLLLAWVMPEGSPHGFLFHPLAHPATAGEGDTRGLEPSLFQHIPLAGCHSAVIRLTPVADQVRHLSSDGILVDYEILYMPLADDAGAVAAVLILAVETLPNDFIA